MLLGLKGLQFVQRESNEEKGRFIPDNQERQVTSSLEEQEGAIIVRCWSPRHTQQVDLSELAEVAMQLLPVCGSLGALLKENSISHSQDSLFEGEAAGIPRIRAHPHEIQSWHLQSRLSQFWAALGVNIYCIVRFSENFNKSEP